MKSLRILSRSIRDSFRNVFRNFSLSLASISCIVITLLVVSISIILSYNVNNFSELVKKDVTIVTFLDVDVDDDDIKDIKTKLEKIDNIETITFESKDKIAKDMINTSETYAKIIEKWEEGENPLQDTYLIKVKNIEDIDQTAKEIKKIKGVDIVKYGEGMIDQLVYVFNGIKKITIGMVIALVLVTAFLISNTIKITIFSRKREIEIMRLVGASNLNIKIPFLFEGLLLGVLGSIIPIVVTIIGYNEIYNKFNGQLFSPFIKLIEPNNFVIYISFILLAISIIVGMFGSLRAVKKHLKI